MGTPAYMPPEQANGETDRIDEGADVFGLGAILCVVLTGQPPYVGPSGDAVYAKAVRGDLADGLARLDACGAEADLIDLAKGCLSPDPSDRPADGKAVPTDQSRPLRCRVTVGWVLLELRTDVPHLRRPVLAAGDDPLPVRAERHAV
jgi:serine/threonine protein kinase